MVTSSRRCRRRRRVADPLTGRRCAEWEAAPRSPLRGLFHQGFHNDDRPPQGFPYGQPSAGLDRASFSKGLDTAEHYAACRGEFRRSAQRTSFDR